MTKAETIDYYAKRSAEYERIYDKPERQNDLEQLRTTLAGMFGGLDLLEIACGTGYWTQCASRSATSIVATDYSEEVLDIAREKEFGDCPVTFVKADAYSLDGVDGPFSAGLVCFWWSHIPNVQIDNFLRVLHSKLAKGATVVVLDNRYVEGSSTPISRTDNEGNSYQTRKLGDGSKYEIVKNFPNEDEFKRRIDAVAEDCSFTTLEYFWLAQYTLAVSAADQGATADGSRRR